MAGNQFGSFYLQGRPTWMREGTLRAALPEGYRRSEVVGESRRVARKTLACARRTAPT